MSKQSEGANKAQKGQYVYKSQYDQTQCIYNLTDCSRKNA